ncbi:MAG: hypothetical protein DBX63_11875 [Clostridia bacterium]|nr:MAG: hypothetical protein DBX63_11875 [Clostridia bacterium]
MNKNKRRNHMKKALALLMTVALFACSFAACQQNETPDPTPAQQDQNNGQSNEQPSQPDNSAQPSGAQKESVVWAQPSDITSLDFHVGKNPASFAVTCNIFDTLVTWDAENKVIPHLASEWEFVDEDSLQLKLREGVLFHDGEELTAEDVQYTLTRAKNSTIVKNNFSWLDSVDVVDEYTVVVNTIGAYAPVLNALCNPLAGIMPKHLLEADDEAMAKNPVGTGPFKFVERKEGEYVKMEANESYWNGTVASKYLEMRVVPEASQRATLLETDEIDIAYDMLASDVERLNSGEKATVLSAPSFKVFYLTINCNSGTAALQDARVRQAIEYAIDKDALCSAVMYGYATPVSSLVGPGVFGYDAAPTANLYDVEKAKSLLSEAGYADGFEMSIWVQSSDQIRQEACVIIQSMLEEVGITVTVEPMDGTVMDDTIVKGGDFAACSSMYYNLMGDADYVLYSNISPESTSNLSHYSSEAAMEKLLAARSLTDDAARAAVYAEISAIMAQDRPYIPLWAYQNLVGVRTGVQGFVLSPITAYRYENVAVYEG